MILKRIFRRPPAPERVVYEAIVAAARHADLYAILKVPDTLDGRFDMITLHAFLVLDRLKGTEAPFRQKLVDELFADMDRSLRELGVGDISVGKKVRKMAEVFYGRIAAYDKAQSDANGELADTFARNIFDGSTENGALGLADYFHSQRLHLRSQDPASIAAGNLDFKEPNP